MAFRQLFIIGICSTLTQALTAIFLAWAGFGFISLAWSAVAGTFASCVVSSLYRLPGQPWLPGISEWRRVFSAGTKLSTSSIFNEVGLGGPELATGRILGFEAVAHFSRGFGAAMLVFRALVDTIQPVAISYFANQSRSRHDMAPQYLDGIAYMSGIAFPAFACLITMTEPIILLLYGRQWLDAVIPLQIVSFGFACLAVATVASSVLVGSGKIGANLRIQAIFQPFKVLLVALGAMLSGLSGVAAGVAIGDACISMCCFAIVNRQVGVCFLEFCRSILPSFAIAFVTALLTWIALNIFLPLEPPLVQVTVISVGAVICWTFGLFLTKHPISKELLKLLPQES